MSLKEIEQIIFRMKTGNMREAEAEIEELLNADMEIIKSNRKESTGCSTSTSNKSKSEERHLENSSSMSCDITHSLYSCPEKPTETREIILS